MIEVRLALTRIRRYLELLGDVVGYQFDEADWDAVQYGTRGLNPGTVESYEYSLFGAQTTQLNISLCSVKGEVSVKVLAEPKIENLIGHISTQTDSQVIATVRQAFALASRPSHFTN